MSFKKIVCILSFFICFLSFYYYMQVAFNNNYENNFLYETLTVSQPTSNNIQGLYSLNQYAYFRSVADGAKLFLNNKKMTEISPEKLKISRDPYAYSKGKTGQIFVNKETLNEGAIIVYTLRPIFNWIKIEYLMFYGLLIMLLIDLRSLKNSSFRLGVFCKDNFYIYFLMFFSLLTVLNITAQNPILTGGAADASGYLSYSFLSLEQIAGTLRTPGYPWFLAFVRQFSPMGLGSLVFWQTLIYMFSLAFLIYSLVQIKLNRYIGVFLFWLFSSYFSNFLSAALADSLGLSGIVLLVAFSVFYCANFNNKSKIKKSVILILISTVCFIQLMIKPFPGTILFAPGIFFIAFLGRVNWRKLFGISIILFLLSVIPATAYCTYRYMKFDNFNFASLANISLLVQGIALSDETILSDDNVSKDTKDLVRMITEEFNKDYYYKIKWPIVFDDSLKNLTFRLCVNRFWFHSSLNNFLYKKYVGNKKLPTLVIVDNMAGPYAKEIMKNISWYNRWSLIKSYYRSVKNIDITKKYGLETFYPFNSLANSIIFLIMPLFIIISFKVLKKHINSVVELSPIFDSQTLIVLLTISILVPFLCMVTMVIIAPFCEVRREIISLWGWFFGWITVGGYLSLSAILLIIKQIIVISKQDDLYMLSNCTKGKWWNNIAIFASKYFPYRCLLFIVLMFFYVSFTHNDSARITLLINSSHNIDIVAKNCLLFNQDLVIRENEIKNPRWVSFFVPSSYLLQKPITLAINSSSKAKTSMHVLQIEGKNFKQEYIHGKIKDAFTFSRDNEIISIDSKYGVTFKGSQELILKDAKQNSTKSFAIKVNAKDERKLLEKLFPNWSYILIFTLFALLNLALCCSINKICFLIFMFCKKIRKGI